MFICTQQRVSAHVSGGGGRPADLSRKARPGSAEMSGCYGDLPASTSTEQYRMVKGRRGRGVSGCQSRNGRVMDTGRGLRSQLELSSSTSVATAHRNIRVGGWGGGG